MSSLPVIHSTTVVALQHKGQIALAADGQASLGNTIAKHNVNKIRTFQQGGVVTGFAGSTADAFTLLERFDQKLSSHRGGLLRAAVALAKDWRTDRYLRKLEAMLLVVDKSRILLISGTGDVLEPDKGVAAIGSGSMYAQSAALALKKHAPHLTAEQMVEEALKIAADICIYTNDQIRVAIPK